MLLQTGTVEPCKGLIEACLHGAEDGLDEAVGSGLALAVDEFNEQFALRVGELLHSRRIGTLDVLLDQAQMLVARLLIGQRLQVFVSLTDNEIALLCNG